MVRLLMRHARHLAQHLVAADDHVALGQVVEPRGVRTPALRLLEHETSKSRGVLGDLRSPLAHQQARHKHECGKRLEVGEEFLLKSLKSRPELNGCRVVVVERGMDEATRAVGVRIVAEAEERRDQDKGKGTGGSGGGGDGAPKKPCYFLQISSYTQKGRDNARNKAPLIFLIYIYYLTGSFGIVPSTRTNELFGIGP